MTKGVKHTILRSGKKVYKKRMCEVMNELSTSTNPKKTFKGFMEKCGTSLAMPFIMIILGLFMIIWGNEAVDMVVRMIGIVVLVVGVGLACTLLAGLSPATMAFAILLVVTGLICIVNPGGIAAYVMIIIGVFVLVNSIMRIRDAYRVKAQTDFFKQFLINDLITLFLGLFMIIFNKWIIVTMARVAGVIILILGITNLVTAIKVYYDGGRYVDDGTDVVWEE